MRKRITNGIGLRREKEAAGIALNESGSYVLRSFDPDEFDRVNQFDFSKLKFGEEEFVVVARGTQGTLAKLARVTGDRQFARYFGGKHVSVALLEGEVFSQAEFIRSIAQNPTLRVVRARDSKEFVGILHGDRTKNYKSLVYPVPNGFLILDLEENPPPQSSEMLVRIAAEEPPEGAAIKAELLKRFA
jgi:hypothetical protein